jgi:hypothetical protein
VIALLLACTGGPLPPPATDDTAVVPLEACDPALTLAPDGQVVEAWGLVQLVAQGGTGAHRFSGTGVGDVAEFSGAFVAQDEAGVAKVTVTDDGCLGQAEVTVQVVEGLTLSPYTAGVEPGSSVAFAVTGGSGDWSCSLLADASGAQLDPGTCAYVAGTTSGTDRVRVQDAVTGAFADALVDVDAGLGFTVWGQEQVVVPKGATFRFTPVNGSGHVTLEVRSGSLVVEGDTVVSGQGTVRVRDAFVDRWVDVPVRSVDPIAPDATRDGERSGRGIVVPAGDVDGDGYDDAVVGLPEVSNQAHYSGQVALYLGSDAGLVTAPARVWSGASTNEALGRGVAVGDLDGDGHPDLLAGSGGMDRGETNNGGVHVFYGRSGQIWSETPDITLVGQLEYDRFGDAIALCDFDADGWLDVAVGAPDSQDDAQPTVYEEQGSVQIFRGSQDGLADKPDFVLYGLLPYSFDEWQGQEEMHVGEALAAGDFDGDGLCDLAAGGSEADFDGGSGDQGVVLVWRGTTSDGLVLERTPSAILAARDGDSGEFGRAVAAGDVDGDGAAELLVGHWSADEFKSNGGSAHLYSGLDLGGAREPVETSDAVWTVYGTASSDYIGTSVALHDMNGDGEAEILIGGYRVEDDSRTNQGVVLYYDALKAKFDGTREGTERASKRILGPNKEGRFGQAVGPVGSDGLLVLAGYDSTWGVQAGATWYAPLWTGEDPVLLDFPGQASGHDYGRAMRLQDIDNDGVSELLFGAPGAGEPSEGANSGILYAYDFDGAVVGAPTQILGGHHSWSSSDRYGHSLATGDFDGDGRDDLFVVARKDSKLSDLDDSYANPDECNDYDALAGAVLIYRGIWKGYESEPTWIVHAPESYAYVDQVLSGFDHDGDGRDDVAFGGIGWGGGGGFSIAHGRARNSSGMLMICDAESYLSSGTHDRLGTAFASLGDLDGDGCDELAAGGTGTEYGSDYYNQGMVHLLWGWGGSCGNTAQVSELSLRTVGAGIGSAMDTWDVDGDGLLDLVVGGAERRADFAEMGGAWVSPGAHIAQAERFTVDAGELPDLDSVGFDYLVPDDGLSGLHGLLGPSSGSLFGQAVAWVELADGSMAIAVGMPQGSLGGPAHGGGVALYRYDRSGGVWGLDPVPAVVIGGEAAPGELGDTLWFGEGVLLVGAPTSSAVGVQLGAGYAVSLD